MSIAENLQRVRGQIADAASSADRNPDDVTLVAVSKTWPAEAILEAFDAGQRVFGENKVQEILEKVDRLPDEVEWHLVGHLQKNKTRKVLPLCSCVHSVDSLALAERMGRVAGDLGIAPSVLLQVNVAGDDAKFGFPERLLREQFGAILAVERLEIAGLMTVPSFDPDPEKTRPFFARLRELRDELAEASGHALPALSMGMSHDFAVAVEEGATLVRVGSSIFGKRDYSR
ncbi:MAG: YggS family pyridoxal phosphate-dependent enzyme [Verrucomicrobiales bacterium]